MEPCVRRPFGGHPSVMRDHETKPSSPAMSLSLSPPREALLSSLPSGHPVPCPHAPTRHRLRSRGRSRHSRARPAGWPTRAGPPRQWLLRGRVFCLPPGPRETGRQSLWVPWCLPRQGGARRSRDPFRAPRAGAAPTVLPPLGFPYPQGSLSGRLLLLPRPQGPARTSPQAALGRTAFPIWSEQTDLRPKPVLPQPPLCLLSGTRAPEGRDGLFRPSEPRLPVPRLPQTWPGS